MTSAEKASWRARAQTLKPAVKVGRGGVTPALIKELDAALKRAELVKVRFGEGREILRTQCAELATATHSECVGGLGHVASFYRILLRSSSRTRS
jgi:RNA-binding protein